jgi:hypothetical protein
MFHMQEQIPAVVHLAVHLPEEHTIVFNAEQDVELQEALEEYVECYHYLRRVTVNSKREAKSC